MYRIWTERRGYYSRGFRTLEEVAEDLRTYRGWSTASIEPFIEALERTGKARRQFEGGPATLAEFVDMSRAGGE